MIPYKNALEAVEMEEITSLVGSDVESKVPTRWERKQQQAQYDGAIFSATPRKRALPADSKPYHSPAGGAKSPAAHVPATGGSKENQTLNRIGGATANAGVKKAFNNAVSSRGAMGTPSGSDRFIPARSALDFDNVSFTARSITLEAMEMEAQNPPSPSTQEFNRVLQANMGAESNSRVLHYKARPPTSTRTAADALFDTPVSVLYSQQSRRTFTSQIPVAAPSRNIPSTASRTLDAPGFLDDFYINPIDWSCANQLAVGLGKDLYLWTAATGTIDELPVMKDLPDNSSEVISAVKFVPDGGSLLAIGSTLKTIQLYDLVAGKTIRTLHGHSARVTSLAWNKHILTTGGRDATIFHHDVRMQNTIVSTLKDGHASEVCQLKWNEDGTNLASGGNDNLACVWDTRSGNFGDTPRLRLTQHTAAVKAMAWCPYQRNVLVTGGGTSDRTIKIWNAANGTCEQSIDTGSQVCSLVFNPHEKELLSSHGFSNCELTLWKFPSMAKIKDLTGHTNRVLHTCLSPDGSTVCSAAADESIRFWEVFGLPKKQVKTEARFGMNIR